MVKACSHTLTDHRPGCDKVRRMKVLASVVVSPILRKPETLRYSLMFLSFGTKKEEGGGDR